MECTIANISKELTSFSDFPVPIEFPIYMPATYFKQYIDLYAEKFDLKKHVQLQTQVRAGHKQGTRRYSGCCFIPRPRSGI